MGYSWIEDAWRHMKKTLYRPPEDERKLYPTPNKKIYTSILPQPQENKFCPQPVSFGREPQAPDEIQSG